MRGVRRGDSEESAGVGMGVASSTSDGMVFGREAWQQKYQTQIVTSVDPATGKPNGWCRYSIESFGGSVTGLRHGSMAEVKLYAEETAEAFNLRNMLGNRRPPIWTSHHKK